MKLSSFRHIAFSFMRPSYRFQADVRLLGVTESWEQRRDPFLGKHCAAQFLFLVNVSITTTSGKESANSMQTAPCKQVELQ